MAIASPREVNINTEVVEYQVQTGMSVAQLVPENGDRIALLISAHGINISIGWDQKTLAAGTGHTMLVASGIALDLTMSRYGGLVCRALYAVSGGIGTAYITEIRYIRR